MILIELSIALGYRTGVTAKDLGWVWPRVLYDGHRGGWNRVFRVAGNPANYSVYRLDT